MAAPTPSAFTTQPEEVVASMQDRNSAGPIDVGKLTSQTSSGQLVSRWSSSAKKVLSAQRASSGFVTLRDQFSVKEVDPKELKTQQRLGEGAFAVVDKCILTAPGQDARVVAVKRLKKEVANSPLDLEAFLTEVALMRKLKHKSIVTYIGLGADDHSTEENAKLTMFFVQEFMGGGTLRKLVSKQMSEPHRTVYTNAQALQWMIDIASSLAYLHSSNPIVIHRDLKMDNILLTSDKANAKLADFGLAGLTRHTAHKRGKTEDGAVVVTATEQVDDQFRAALAKATSNRRGTLRRKEDAMFQPSTLKAEAVLPGKTGTLMYMAPEMYNDEPYTEKVDVFSFGIIMHELFSRYLTVCAISNSGTESEVEAYVSRVANGFRPPLEDQMWHEQLKSLIRDCWAQSPSSRPDMATVVKRLQQMQKEGVIAEEAPMGCSCCVVS